MRIVVCDDDSFMREMVESLVGHTGHEVVGIADTTAAGVGLIETARPDAVLLDVSLGFETDFDLIEAAIEVGARTIVFTRNPDVTVLSQHRVAPIVVTKPDLEALEQVLLGLDQLEPEAEVVEHDRRRQPARAAAGPVPTGLSDAQAFFEAVNGARPGDALVSLDVPVGAEAVADEVGHRLRETDRLLLMLPRAVRVYLPGGGDDGIRAVLERIKQVPSVSSECQAASVVIGEGEEGADAFERLKRDGELHPL